MAEEEQRVQPVVSEEPRPNALLSMLYTAGLGILGALVTQLTIDYTYPLLRSIIIGDSAGTDNASLPYEENEYELTSEDVTYWRGQRIVK